MKLFLLGKGITTFPLNSHSRDTLITRFVSPAEISSKVLTNFSFLKMRPHTFHMKTWSPSGISHHLTTQQPKWDHWNVIMGWTWAKPSQGKKKLLSEQFTSLREAEQVDQGGLQGDVPHTFALLCACDIKVCLAQTQWLQFQKDRKR